MMDNEEPNEEPNEINKPLEIIPTTLHPIVQELIQPVKQWATLLTDPTMAAVDHVIRSKMRTILEFFAFVEKPPQRVTPGDVFRWQQQLRLEQRAETTIYSWVSRISSFYGWLLKDPIMAQQIDSNPVLLARPKAPVPYAKARPLGESEIERLIAVIHERAASGDIVGYRDYALLLFYILTGMSRTEILRLCWKNIEITDQELIFSVRVHSGRTRTRSIRDATLRDALLDYLAASGRFDIMQADDPLWIRHDYGSRGSSNEPPTPLTVQAVDKAMRRYATQAGIDGFHLHRLRHAYARMAAEELDNVDDVRRSMGHRMLRTTHQLLSQISIEPDRISERIAQRLNLDTLNEQNDE